MNVFTFNELNIYYMETPLFFSNLSPRILPFLQKGKVTLILPSHERQELKYRLNLLL